MATAADCMVLANSALTTKLYFRPGSAVLRQTRRENNQATTVCESGRAVVAQLAANDVRYFEVEFNGIPLSDEAGSEYGVTLAGMNTVLTFITDTAQYRLTEVKFKPKGDSDTAGNYRTVRVWQSDITYDEPERKKVYNFKITLRQEGLT